MTIERARAHPPSTRRIVSICQGILGVPRPLAALTFKTGGRHGFVEQRGALVDIGT